ncbi:hypothetical protein MGYG_08009 [Nannizzia gypsea CBS 118893]|uniref:Tho complex subunit 7 n=1 Tax=Arthroderma gypseum (strain ATCC MYA-4604 / CBS 118893) TaxID=535722 RepID=E4V4T2_ARTGP|nr:hypothetical protein MGYG_08009 [Nannizzia gypsea CBS 118893]EFR05006.1 hypothetical protein MGYG_08009 [Nannizzia gypsea CBS 118893]
MENYSLLDQVDEDGLHRSRLLNVEEKPFKRITKRLLAPNSLISSPGSFLATPPPEATNANQEHEAEKQKMLEEWRQLREDITLDFTAFESSLVRIQLLLASNEKERERYAAEKLEIMATAQEVRDNTTELRSQLEEAQNTLALRKTYDELADKITSNRLLRPRDDQQANLEKLHAEIAKLEKESSEYAQTWAERREQFGRIVDEGMHLRRLIRDEKEEVERREGMEEDDDGDEGDASSKGKRSAVSTPRPDPDSSMTPSQQTGGGGEETKPAIAKLQAERSGPATRGGTPLRQTFTASEAATPEDKETAKDDGDENMADEGEISGDEGETQEGATSQGMEDDFEEGEEISDTRPTEKMDTT